MECFPKVLWIALRFCLSKEPPLCIEGAGWLLAVQCEHVSKVGEREGRKGRERELLAHCREKLCSLRREMRSPYMVPDYLSPD